MPGSVGDLRIDDSARLLAALLLVALLVAIVAAVAIVSGVVGSPSITATESRFEAGNDTTTVVRSNVTITNPNPVTVPPGGVDMTYRIEMNGRRMGEGEVTDVRLRPGNTTVTVRTPVENRRVRDWIVSHLRNGERTNYTYEQAVRHRRLNRTLSRQVQERTIETDVAGTLETDEPRPVNASLPGIADPVLYLNESTARWTNVTENRSTMRVNLTLYNPNSARIPAREVTYGVSMNGVALADGSTEDLEPIPARSTRNVTARIVVDNGNLTEWWVSHVRRNQTSSVRIDYAVRVSLTRSGSLTTTVTPDPITRTLHTDVFGDRSERVRVTENESAEAE